MSESHATDIDGDILALARRMAAAERRPAAELIESALVDYAERRGEAPPRPRPAGNVLPEAAKPMAATDIPLPHLRSVGPEDEVRAGPEAPDTGPTSESPKGG